MIETHFPVAKLFSTSFFSMLVLTTSLIPEIPDGWAIFMAAAFVGLVNLYVARTARLVALRAVQKIVEPIQAKIEELVPVVTKIDAHVNSEKTRDQGIIASQLIQLDMQQVVINDLKEAAATLARAKALAEMASAVAAAAVAGATTPPAGATVQPTPSQQTTSDKSLQRIDANTERTADNTARTDAAVQDLKDKA